MMGNRRCNHCGTWIHAPGHICTPEQRIQWQLEKARPGIDNLEHDIRQFLETPAGQFARYYAEHRRP